MKPAITEAINEALKLYEQQIKVLTGCKISLKFRYVWEDDNKFLIKLRRIICDVYGIKITQLYSKSRKKNIVLARQMMYYILYVEYKIMTLQQIADDFDLDHATVSHGRDMIMGLMEINDTFTTQKYEEIIEKINNY